MPARKSPAVTTPASAVVAAVPKSAIPDTIKREAEQRNTEIATGANEYRLITNDEQYAAAGAYIVECINPALGQLDAAIDPIKDAAHKLHRMVVDTKKQLAAPLETAKATISAEMGRYHREVQRRQIEAAREMERARQQAAEELAAQRAAELLDAGRDDEAQEVLDQLSGGEVRQVSPPLPVKVVGPKAAGVTVRKLKRYRVVDVDKVKREFMVPDEARIQKIVEAMGVKAESMVGGIEYYEVDSVGARGR